ncbi:hypothetical protein [Patulibacter sp. SYSU D01012]|uniref:hypothetical protein n=1 Tax=Patulibacter sp. SYSU D01012 TaxID=2817381 RepID=UPI001B308767|nr:hypothetical protein [Patulibacter sp. SYSU D01012]
MTLLRRPLLLLPAVLAATLVALLAVLAVRPTWAAPPNRLLVGALEWRLELSRQSVRPGPLVLQLQNRGEDAHDLYLQRVRRDGRPYGRTLRVAVTPSGRLTTADLSLARGRWRLWCSLPGHRMAGMQAFLRVG